MMMMMMMVNNRVVGCLLPFLSFFSFLFVKDRFTHHTCNNYGLLCSCVMTYIGTGSEEE